ncbi:MAG: YhjD/YihY/BrkB family envelope integrity protein [Mycobacteriales bacterium]
MALPSSVADATARYRRLRDRAAATPLGQVVWAYAGRFREIDARSRVAAIALDVFVALVPLAIVGAAFRARDPSSHAFGLALVRRFGLHGRVARELIRAFPAAAVTTRAASLLVVGGFVVAGFDLTNALQTTYDMAWRCRTGVSGLKATLKGASWLGFGAVFAIVLTAAGPAFGDALLGRLGYRLVVVLPMGVLFWMVTPRMLLSTRLPWRAFVPGAVLSTVGLLLLQETDYLFLPSTIDQYFQLLGALGVAIALIFWLWLVALLWVSGAVLSAILWERKAP